MRLEGVARQIEDHSRHVDVIRAENGLTQAQRALEHHTRFVECTCAFQSNGARTQRPGFLQDTVGAGRRTTAVQANRVNTRIDHSVGRRDRERKHPHLFGDDVDQFDTIPSQLFLRVLDWVVVAIADLDDDVDTLLVDDDTGELTRGQRQLIAMLLSSGKTALDRLAGIEHGSVHRTFRSDASQEPGGQGTHDRERCTNGDLSYHVHLLELDGIERSRYRDSTWNA